MNAEAAREAVIQVSLIDCFVTYGICGRESRSSVMDSDASKFDLCDCGNLRDPRRAERDEGDRWGLKELVASCNSMEIIGEFSEHLLLR